MRTALVIVLFFTFLALNHVVAQDTSLTCSHFRLLTESGGHLAGISGQIVGDTFSGVDLNGGQVQVPVSQITVMERHNGTQAAKGALIGAAVGAFSVLMAIMNIQADPNRKLDNSRVGPVLFGFTAGGAAIGALVGAACPRWERVSLPGSFGVAPAQRPGLTLTIHF